VATDADRDPVADLGQPGEGREIRVVSGRATLPVRALPDCRAGGARPPLRAAGGTGGSTTPMHIRTLDADSARQIASGCRSGCTSVRERLSVHIGARSAVSRGRLTVHIGARSAVNRGSTSAHVRLSVHIGARSAVSAHRRTFGCQSGEHIGSRSAVELKA